MKIRLISMSPMSTVSNIVFMSLRLPVLGLGVQGVARQIDVCEDHGRKASAARQGYETVSHTRMKKRQRLGPEHVEEI